jgi:putative flippase GtrA
MRRLARQLLRFGVVGVLGLLVDVAVLYLGLWLGLGYHAGRVLSFLCAVWVTWRCNRRYTFHRNHGAGPQSAWGEWWHYLAAMAVGGGVNFAAYSAALLVLPPAPWLGAAAVAVGSLAGMSVNFISAKFFVFKS